MIKVVYIAGPFRGINAWEVERNVRESEALALEVWKLGAAAISPHANTRFFDGALDNDIFLKGDLEIVLRCDALLMMAGWKKSEGAIGERDLASRRGLPIFYNLEDLSKWLKWENLPPGHPRA